MARKSRNISKNLVLAGTKKPQMQRLSRRGWTKVKEREFLTMLAETCNDTRSA